MTTAAPTRSLLTAAVTVLAALGLVQLAARLFGFVVLLGVVLACVGALTVGILVLKAAAGH